MMFFRDDGFAGEEVTRLRVMEATYRVGVVVLVLLAALKRRR